VVDVGKEGIVVGLEFEVVLCELVYFISDSL
jgi:hypothetical protein